MSCGRLAGGGEDDRDLGVWPREQVYLLRAEELERLLFELAGAATVPLLQDHPDYAFPSAKVGEAVQVFIRQAEPDLAEYSSIPIENYPSIPERVARRFAMLMFMELHGYTDESDWERLPTRVRDGMAQTAVRTLMHLWPQLVRYFSIPEVLQLAAAPPSDADVRHVALEMFAAKRGEEATDAADAFEAAEEPIRANFEKQARVALNVMAWRHGRRADRQPTQIDPEEATKLLELIDAEVLADDLGVTRAKLVSISEEEGGA